MKMLALYSAGTLVALICLQVAVGAGAVNGTCSLTDVRTCKTQLENSLGSPWDNRTLFCSKVPSGLVKYNGCVSKAMMECEGEDLLTAQTEVKATRDTYDRICPKPKGDCPGVKTCLEFLPIQPGAPVGNPFGQEYCRVIEKEDVGGRMLCYQFEIRKCTGVDPFEGIRKAVLKAPTEGMNLLSFFSSLQLFRSNGDINTTSWTNLYHLMCKPGCRGNFTQNIEPLVRKCVTPLVSGGNISCQTGQDALNCLSDASKQCPLMAWIVHKWSLPFMTQQVQGCQFKVTVPLPELQSSANKNKNGNGNGSNKLGITVPVLLTSHLAVASWVFM